MQQSRQEMAKTIIADPQLYKVCEGCGSIVTRGTPICPNCSAYRFDGDHDYIIEQAVLLASREQRSVTPEDLSS